MSLLRRFGMVSLCLWITAAVALAQPSITTRSAVNVLSTTATLRADINPNGTATQYMFAYGTTKNYGKTTSVSRLSGGNQVQTVTADIGSLAPNTTYHFCIMANHSGKSLVYGQDMTFTTTAPGTEPTAVTLDASDIESSGAVLRGRVYTGGMPTSYAFDYGLTDACSESTEWFSVAAGVQPVDVSVALANLKPETSYYFRVKATNTQGSSKGDLKKFTTAKEVIYPENPIAVSLSSYDFGEVEIGHGGSCTLTFTNTSNVEVTVESFYLHNNFSADWHGGILKAQEAKDITVSFYPFVSGPAHESQALTATCGSNTQSINLSFSGTGYLFREGVEAVDLGLSVKWADRNLGASVPEHNGAFFSWGATEPSTYYGWPGYCYGTGTSNEVTKYCTDSNKGPVDNLIELELADDAACQWLGEGWRIPSSNQVEELREQCTWTWDDDRLGYVVTGPNDNAIFLPATGGGHESMYKYGGEQGYYWTRNLDVSYCADAEAMTFGGGSTFLSNSRSMGFAIRPVFEAIPPHYKVTVEPTQLDFGEIMVGESKTMIFRISNEGTEDVTINSLPSNGGSRYGHFTLDWTGGGIAAGHMQTVSITYTAEAPTEKDEMSFDVTWQGMAEDSDITVSFCAVVLEKDEPDEMTSVDLGLPSGTLWADRNVGAISIPDVGDLFAWGETQTKKYYDWETYFDTEDDGDSFFKYYNEGGLTELSAKNDAATVNCGTEWRTPTAKQIQELIECCTWNDANKRGQSGIEVVGPNGNSIFLPDPGSYTDDRYPMVAGSFAYYWTRSLSTADSNQAHFLYYSFSSWEDRNGNQGIHVKPKLNTTDRSWGQVIRPVHETAETTSAITVTPTTLDFGEMVVGESKTQSFVITNDSDCPVIVGPLPSSGGTRYGHYNLDWTEGTIAAGAAQTVNITYTADATVDKDENSFTITYSGMPEDKEITLSFCASITENQIPDKEDGTCLIVWHKDGTKMSFKFDEKPKVTFVGDSVLFITETVCVEYEFEAIAKMTYNIEDPSMVAQTVAEGGKPFHQDGELISFFSPDVDLFVRIISDNGVIRKEFAVERDETVELPLNMFDTGVFLVSVNGVTYKMYVK